MEFLKKQWKNILFFGLLIFMFTPAGMPLRALLIKGVSFVTSRVENLEITPEDRQTLSNVNWQLFDQHGKMVDYNDYKNKVVLINNWATWCPPCVAEMPSLADLYKDYGNKVVFLFVAHDKPEKVNAFLSKNEMQIPVYFTQTAMPKALQSPTIPTTFVISKNGEIVVKKTGAADWNSGQVHKILDKLINE
jgi:thiol-disulfide isomerase/thioredoxin